MKSALIAAIVAVLVSSSASVAATRYISGSKIKPHSIAASRLTSSAVATLMAKPAVVSVTGSPSNTPAPDGSIPPTAIVATCPTGDAAVSGGYRLTTPGQGFTLYTDGPTADGTGWEIDAAPTVNNTPTLVVTAGCVAIG